MCTYIGNNISFSTSHRSDVGANRSADSGSFTATTEQLMEESQYHTDKSLVSQFKFAVAGDFTDKLPRKERTQAAEAAVHGGTMPQPARVVSSKPTGVPMRMARWGVALKKCHCGGGL